MPDRRVTGPARAAVVAALVAVGYLAVVHGLGGTRLVDETEPIFAESSRQMFETGDWITPVFNGAPRFDKPPLVYWLQAASYRLLGVCELAARLPSAVAAIAVAAAIFLAVFTLGPWACTSGDAQRDAAVDRRRWGASSVAALAWLLAPETWIWGRTAVSDMLLTATVTGSLLSFAAGWIRGSSRWFVAAAAWCALGTLAKGPVAPVLVGLTAAAAVGWAGQSRGLFRMLPCAASCATFAAIAAPWHVLVIAQHGRAFTDVFFGYHNLERFVSVVNRHAGPWWYYAPVLVAGFLPWSVLLARAILHQRPWDRATIRRRVPADVLGLVAWVWLAVVAGFFTLARTKLPSYILPALPAAAILVGLAWPASGTPAGKDGPRVGRGAGRIEAVLLAMVWAAFAAVCWFAPSLANASGDRQSEAIVEAAAAAGLLRAGVVIGVGAACLAVWAGWRRQTSRLPVVTAVSALAVVVLIVLPAARLTDRHRQQPLYNLAAAAAQAASPADQIVMVGFWKPSLVFYTRRSVVFVPTMDVYRALPVAPTGRRVVIAEAGLWPNEQPDFPVVRRAGSYVLAVGR